MTAKRIFFIQLLIAFAYCLPAHAQQEPIYSQYMFNGLVINPSYASTDESASLTVIARNQWVGVDGAPKTAALSFYTPVKESKTSVGFSVMNERITVTSRTDFNLVVAQKVSLTEEWNMSLGLQGGMSQYKENNSQLTTTDPAFANNKSYWKTNVGFGFSFFTEDFYLGISAPVFKGFDLGGKENKIATKPHLYLQTAYAFHVNDDLIFKPSLLLREVKGNGFQYDVNASVLIRELLWLGASWRSEKTVTGLVQVQVTPQFGLGYSYDTPTSSNLKGAQSSSHELMLNYRFGWNAEHEVNPRIF